MILDARRIPLEERLDCDICIVGAGPAGLSLALELEGSGARICVLEAGGADYEKASQAFCDGDVSGDSYPALRDTRFAAFGGSTQLWAGWCRPLDPIDFERRPWVPESGWPFGREELLPHYERAHALCRLGEFEYDPDYWERKTGHHRLPFSDEDLTTKIFHVSSIRFGRAYRTRFENLPNVRVLLHAPVLRLHFAPSSERIESASVATLEGTSFSITAKTFVVATGGIENARLLLLSGDSPERSPGNDHGLVGRYFTEHAFIHPGTFIPSRPDRSLDFYFPTPVDGAPTGASVRGTFSLSRNALERDELLNSALFFRPAHEAHPVFETAEVQALLDAWEQMRGRGVPGRIARNLLSAARRPGALSTAIWRKLSVRDRTSNRWALRAFFESEPKADNVVSLSRRRDALGRPLPTIRWTIAEADLRGIRSAFHVLDRALRASQAGHLELAFPDETDAWREAAVGGKHHMGTTRMHDDPSRGVVDANSRVHGTANLYVTGSSVFPTVGYANPTLTIVALAVRLGRHLRPQLEGTR